MRKLPSPAPIVWALTIRSDNMQAPYTDTCNAYINNTGNYLHHCFIHLTSPTDKSTGNPGSPSYQPGWGINNKPEQTHSLAAQRSGTLLLIQAFHAFIYTPLYLTGTKKACLDSHKASDNRLHCLNLFSTATLPLGVRLVPTVTWITTLPLAEKTFGHNTLMSYLIRCQVIICTWIQKPIRISSAIGHLPSQPTIYLRRSKKQLGIGK